MQMSHRDELCGHASFVAGSRRMRCRLSLVDLRTKMEARSRSAVAMIVERGLVTVSARGLAAVAFAAATATFAATGLRRCACGTFDVCMQPCNAFGTKLPNHPVAEAAVAAVLHRGADPLRCRCAAVAVAVAVVAAVAVALALAHPLKEWIAAKKLQVPP